MTIKGTHICNNAKPFNGPNLKHKMFVSVKRYDTMKNCLDKKTKNDALPIFQSFSTAFFAGGKETARVHNFRR